MADKSVITTNSNAIAKAVASTLQAKQVQIKVVTAADDVGIETAVGSRRCAATLKSRIAKGAKRAERNGSLARMNSRAHCLGVTGTQKQQSYGHIAQGASETQVHKMRRNLKAGTNLG